MSLPCANDESGLTKGRSDNETTGTTRWNLQSDKGPYLESGNPALARILMSLLPVPLDPSLPSLVNPQFGLSNLCDTKCSASAGLLPSALRADACAARAPSSPSEIIFIPKNSVGRPRDAAYWQEASVPNLRLPSAHHPCHSRDLSSSQQTGNAAWKPYVNKIDKHIFKMSKPHRRTANSMYAYFPADDDDDDGGNKSSSVNGDLHKAITIGFNSSYQSSRSSRSPPTSGLAG
ncbi:uncharacterized protein BCR38DRAFT_518443 [Pseudomassariella vexata]|uniref:Uncharacterized protein n=1 Tax=Pseudomassariella vexata TaxID=1141098 RepID=A0A1Y2DTJ9_9PEZI|nr:uncharacterized protein BCR38DRAFT_518443 [Pseudomassariella vexata]ORY62612.1 hypothetical protein BCR38DRAFT_518443 [Pseudomassariella vexata]